MHRRPDRSEATLRREGTGSTYATGFLRKAETLGTVHCVGFGSYHYKYDSGREGDMRLNLIYSYVSGSP